MGNKVVGVIRVIATVICCCRKPSRAPAASSLGGAVKGGVKPRRPSVRLKEEGRFDKKERAGLSPWVRPSLRRAVKLNPTSRRSLLQEFQDTFTFEYEESPVEKKKQSLVKKKPTGLTPWVRARIRRAAERNPSARRSLLDEMEAATRFEYEPSPPKVHRVVCPRRKLLQEFIAAARSPSGVSVKSLGALSATPRLRSGPCLTPSTRMRPPSRR